MTRGIRGATTVVEDQADMIIENTRRLVEEMVTKNNVSPEDVSHVFISVTKDITAAFPAKGLRKLPGWTYVPVMCMTEIDVPNSLKRCIRVMMVVNTDKEQASMNHIFQNEAIHLRPDLACKEDSTL
ncbi:MULTISPECIES: chorismate mutase [Virgibacillus]|uniref:chorismate mutase n=1 Tax=Virgibacillus pantothenticus TaxID=1473 RepID=A0A0L0QP58_VIRPA|nr:MULTISPECIES: chorismate mutase [Virgibacillus]API90404.1 chorismate mutase [Virgibacillus sp. 6R]KNE20367.1 chorismate mutase [Virgibacillus pantothenticus]MBS7429508.1 chorismate mutase [Virgibacillus sp. 19R1-5]MBU8567880.1 chorismate mutase [Virgibacillus pantothenticus]MBU8601673.1 chorismate mutase [Virgibacillus pantothenticus]